MDDLVKNCIKDKPEYSSFEGCLLFEICFETEKVWIRSGSYKPAGYGDFWYSHCPIEKVKYCLENLHPSNLVHSSPNPHENRISVYESEDHIEVQGKSTDRLIEEIKKSRPGKTLTDKRY